MRHLAALLALLVAGYALVQGTLLALSPVVMERSTTLPLTPATVYAALESLGGTHGVLLWPLAAGTVRWSGPVVGVGARRVETDAAFPGETTFEIVETQRPNHIAVRLTNPDAPAARYDLRIESVEGETELLWRFERAPARSVGQAWAMWLEERHIDGVFGDGIESSLNHFRALTNPPGPDVGAYPIEWVDVAPFEFLCNDLAHADRDVQEDLDSDYLQGVARLRAVAQRHALPVGGLPLWRWTRHSQDDEATFLEFGLRLTGPATLPEGAGVRACQQQGGPALRALRPAQASGEYTMRAVAALWDVDLRSGKEPTVWSENLTAPDGSTQVYEFILLDCGPPDPGCTGNPACVCQAHPQGHAPK